MSHFLIALTLTLSLLIVGFALFYELVLVCEVMGVSPFWSLPAMVAFYATFTWRPLKTFILRFNR